MDRWPLRSMWKSLARPQGLCEAVRVVQARHLLVAGLGVEAHDVAVLELRDEREGVPDGREEDVAAGLVGLGLERDLDVVALVLDVRGREVEALGVALVRGVEVLGAVVLGALAAAPHDEGLGAERGREVDVAQDLAQRVAADAAVVGREAAVLEDGVAEEVGRDHLDGQAGLVGGLLDLAEELLAGRVVRAEGHDVVVVEREAPRAEVGEPADGVGRVEVGAAGSAELVLPGPAHGPQAEGKVDVLVDRVSHDSLLVEMGRLRRREQASFVVRMNLCAPVGKVKT